MITIVTGTYNLQANPQWRQIALENVYLECDTTLAPVVINLFEIIDLERFWNVKIHISDTNNNASTNSITINSAAGEFINLEGQTSFVINQDGGNCVLQVSSELIWSINSQGNANDLSMYLLDETSSIADFKTGNTYYYIGEAPITYNYDTLPYPLPIPVSGFNFVNLSTFDVTFFSDGGNTSYQLAPNQSLTDIQVQDNFGGNWSVIASEYNDNIYNLEQVTGKGNITINPLIVRNNPDTYRTRYSIIGQQIQRDDLGFNINYVDNGITKTSTGNKTWQLLNPDLTTNANNSVFQVVFRPNLSGTVAYLGDILKTKAGVVSAVQFSGSPKKATVTFVTPFTDANYSVAILGADPRYWSIESVSNLSFVINANFDDNGIDLGVSGNVYWTATKHGEN